MPGNAVHLYFLDVAGEIRAVPPVLKMDAKGGANQDELIVHNQTTEDILVYFGAGAFDNNPGGPSNPEVFAVAANGDTATIQKRAKSKGNRAGALFSYQAIGVTSGRKAKGNSDPMLIIEN